MPPSNEIDTPRGPARIDTDLPVRPATALLVLGHGAGGSVDAPDLLAVRDASVAAGLAVVRVTQPYRVAGRRAPAPAGHLDEAWAAVLAVLRDRHADVPTVVVGGRSSGARVACRTARAVGAVGVVALAFPLHPPGRPERSRAAELDTGLPTLVVNGDRDPFGTPEPGPAVRVVSRPGETHDLRRDPAGTAAAVRDWLYAQGWAAD
ncbi:alpha/beta family hydrolase [Micromonospora ureilytica]|uniref:Alpha/beta-hydrolase family hydrolase n=1 Tax=Micromonospora ureilytica TaxID=709868 RepID=A0ABS0JS06_9ACTN|nr:alpha/beta family hydrolase [Micromonospora ureilytica]MBG6069811.1 putative alpha/beta-hydrolase family hydrolase [Micromonospora ureilytica]WSG32883.1 alpha/beta hydrolase [Micromonospora ureilytica]